MTKSLLIGVPFQVLDADDGTSIESEAFALPARTCVLAWQVSLDNTPGSIDLAFEVAMEVDGPFTPLDSADETDFTNDAFFRTISIPTAARFGRITATNGSAAEVTVSVIAKVANP